jgi:hypothetical protein
VMLPNLQQIPCHSFYKLSGAAGVGSQLCTKVKGSLLLAGS